MQTIIAAILQIIIIFLKNKFEKNADEKLRKEALKKEAKDAIKEAMSTGNVSNLNNVVVSLRGNKRDNA